MNAHNSVLVTRPVPTWRGHSSAAVEVDTYTTRNTTDVKVKKPMVKEEDTLAQNNIKDYQK